MYYGVEVGTLMAVLGYLTIKRRPNAVILSLLRRESMPGFMLKNKQRTKKTPI